MTKLFTLDKAKCGGDGQCASVCPMGIIVMNDKIPMPIKDAEKICVNCGHCVSVCPTNALSLHKMPVSDCVPLNERMTLDVNQVEQLLKGRRSVRQFKTKPVERETLLKIIDISRYAPSATNSQPVVWSVIYETEGVKKLAETVINWMREAKNSPLPSSMTSYFEPMIAAWDKGKDTVCRNAPHIVLTFAPTEPPIRGIDCSIALTYFMLAALPFNVGTCWAGIIQMAAQFSPIVNKALDVPEGNRLYGAMMVGYPQYTHKRIPMRNEAQIRGLYPQTL